MSRLTTLPLTDEELVAIYLMAYRAEHERLGLPDDPDMKLGPVGVRIAARNLLVRVGGTLAERNIDPVSVNLGGVEL